jgi:hypothetical protein
MSLTVAVLGLFQSRQQDGKFHRNKSAEHRIYLGLSIFRFFLYNFECIFIVGLHFQVMSCIKRKGIIYTGADHVGPEGE